MKKLFLRSASLVLVLSIWITSFVPGFQDAVSMRELLSHLRTASAAARTLKDEEAQKGFIKVMDPTTGKKNQYDAILVNEKTIFMPASSLASMTGYNYDGDAHSTVIFQFPEKIRETKIKVEPTGDVTINGETTSVEVVEYQEVYYYHANQILNLLGGQWFQYYEREAEDSGDGTGSGEGSQNSGSESGGKSDTTESTTDAVLMYLPPSYNTFDFVGSVRDTLYAYQIHQDALVNSNDSTWGTAFASGLAVVFNDFDMRILIPVVGDNLIIADQYIEAFETLNVDDSTFLTSSAFSSIGSLVKDSPYETMTFSLGAMDDICSIPENIEKTVDGSLKIIKAIKDSKNGEKLLKFVKEINEALDETDIGKFGDAVGKINTAIDVISIFTTAYQAYERGHSWTNEQMLQLGVLMNLESPANKETQKYINSAAQKLLMEIMWPKEMAELEGVDEAIKLGLEIGVDTLTPLGPVIGLISGGIAIGKTNPEFCRSIESNDLKYMVNCLIKTEALALSEMNKAYSTCITKYTKGTLTENDLADLKTKTKLVLRINLRNASMIYYLDSQLEGAGWEKSDDAKKLNDQIIHDYALLTELEHASNWDYLIRCSNWNKLVNSIGTQDGDIREVFNENIWYPIDGGVGNATNYVQYQGKVYFWGFSGDNFTKDELWASFQPVGGIQTTLLAVDANDPSAKPVEVLKADGCGKIGIWNGRLYYESKECVKSILLDGTSPETYPNARKMLGADDEKGVLVVGDTYYEGVGLLSMGSGEIILFDEKATFMMVEDGMMYYYENPSKGTVNVFSCTTDGTKVRSLGSISQTLFTESELSTMTGTTIDSCQVADNYLYICYGSYAGTGMIFQGGEIARIFIGDTEAAVAWEPIESSPDTCAIYVSVVDGVHKVYYTDTDYSSGTYKNVVRCVTVSDGETTIVEVACHPKGEMYVSGNTICVHPDLSGSEQLLIGPSDYSKVGSADRLSSYEANKDVIEVEKLGILGDWIYYTAERSSYSDSMGWRYSYTRVESVIFRKNLKTGVVQELHSY